ncbi:response regulator transcription factor [Verrucomicrobiaceae bacterium 5K15]|uniref:Response regulator transcription factor n=1 Tax=Oceaniferula flava TaxID=2800421 RepID=A0AAE2VCK1_9BACT|nr:response regulator transcription factor [Oceaniferula flavus]MBK1855176.1 response regulator transcription factor [Oceaniferula flavus]MBM1136482.1 response regulator transcription factor [Oceaniferula flavus]
MKKIRITLVEDSPDYQQVIAFGLEDESDIEVIGTFNTADAALRALKKSTEADMPDLILLDLNLPGISGLEAIAQIKKLAPATEIIILTESEREADVLTAISSGAVGYLLKESSLEQITQGIRTVMSGGASLDPGMARYLLGNQQSHLAADGSSALSPRELEILHLIAEGQVQKKIAAELNISPKTVDFHIGHIYKKLNAPNAPSAVAKAYQSGILRREP